ncbi:MAG: hypothetical protein IKS32_11645 [Solobacterium sp.]|nr:hypothetical protein [Solobacterium sp.]
MKEYLIRVMVPDARYETEYVSGPSFPDEHASLPEEEKIISAAAHGAALKYLLEHGIAITASDVLKGLSEEEKKLFYGKVDEYRKKVHYRIYELIADNGKH